MTAIKERNETATWQEAVEMANDFELLGALLMRYVALGAYRDFVRASAPVGLIPAIEADARFTMGEVLAIATARRNGEAVPSVELSAAPIDPPTAFKGQVLLARMQALDLMVAGSEDTRWSAHFWACLEADRTATRDALRWQLDNPLVAMLATVDVVGS